MDPFEDRYTAALDNLIAVALDHLEDYRRQGWGDFAWAKLCYQGQRRIDKASDALKQLLVLGEKGLELQPEAPVCNCGRHCWAYEQAQNLEQEPCWGILQGYQEKGEDPIHYCQGHGDPTKKLPYTPKPPQLDLRLAYNITGGGHKATEVWFKDALLGVFGGWQLDDGRFRLRFISPYVEDLKSNKTTVIRIPIPEITKIDAETVTECDIFLKEPPGAKAL